MKKVDERKKFEFALVDKEKRKEEFDIDLEALYTRAHEELGLQQSKRDQIITVYLAMFSFLLPFALSLKEIDWYSKGFIMLAMATIGILFALVILRYRIYKEVYWFCCQTITVLMGYKPVEIDEWLIKQVFYRNMWKKARSYFKDKKLQEGCPGEFDGKVFVRRNMFSAETIYYIIHLFITAVLFGLSASLICPLGLWWKVLAGIIAGIVLIAWLLRKYMKELRKVYAVLEDGLDESFKNTFKKAWFLHLY